MSFHHRLAPWLTAGALVILSSLPGGELANDRIEWKTRGPGGGGNMFHVAVSLGDPKIVLMGSDTGGIFRSKDAGQTWQLRNDALVNPGRYASYSERKFAWDPVDPNIVYSGTLKSTDAGFTWHETVNNPYILDGFCAVDPSNHDIVYTVGDGAGSLPALTVYRTQCAWDKPSCPNPPYDSSTTPSLPGARVRSLVVDPSSQGHLVMCTSQGIWEATGFSSWSKMSTPIDDCNDVRIAPNGDLVAVFETQCKCLNDLAWSKCSNLSCGWKDAESWRGGVHRSTYNATNHTWGSWTSLNVADDADLLANLNPGFEDTSQPFPIHWNAASQATWDSTEGHNSAHSVRMDILGTTGSHFLADPLGVQGDTIYRISAWARISYPGCPNGTRTFHAQLGLYSDTQATTPLYFPGDSFNTMNPWGRTLPDAEQGVWKKFEALFRTPTAARAVVLSFYAQPDAGSCTGSTWVDDVSIVPIHGLPEITTYPGSPPEFVNYGPVVVDPTDANTLYVGTRGGVSTLFAADTLGVWKSHWNSGQGRIEWDLVTRADYRDNVLDGVVSAPFCGNGRCEGRGETCTTCPKDCSNTYNPEMPTGGCCGNTLCEPTERGDNPYNDYCLVDCPWEPDANRVGVCTGGSRAGLDCNVISDCPGGTACNTAAVPYYEDGGSGITIQDLDIGSGGSGHNTVYAAGVQGYVSTNGGAKWTEISADHQINASAPYITWKSRGDTNAVVTRPVVTDARVPTRVYYGDRDNFLKVSFDSGQTFSTEGNPGWLQISGLMGSVHSVLLDPTDSNTIYCGISRDDVGDPFTGGAVKGVFNPNPMAPCTNWQWSALGTGFPLGGRVGLARDENGSFYAAVWSQGVFKLTPSIGQGPACDPILLTGQWTNTCAGGCSNWASPPTLWQVYNIAFEPISHRLYVSAGGPGDMGPAPADTVGIWASDDHGATWSKISESNPPSPLSGYRIDWIQPNGPNTLFASTNDVTNGGLFRGTLSDGTWNWGPVPVLAKPIVSGLAISPLDSSLVYAFSGQPCCFGVSETPPISGIWKSTNGGKDSWSLLSNNALNTSLMYTAYGQLSFSAVPANSRTIYASTIGAGVFEGSLLCSDPTREFECAARVNPSAQSVTPGSVVSGVKEDLAAATADDTYETLSESTSGNPRRLTAVWTFSTALSGVDYKLRVEGALGGTTSDVFSFGVVKKNGSSCTGSENYTNVFDLTKTTDNDEVQIGSAGKLTGNQNLFCVRLMDTAASDGVSDTIVLDRVYLVPTSPPPEIVAATDEPQNGAPGIILTGSYLNTQTSDDKPEALQETLQSGNSRLTHIWKFNGVPAGASHLLHVEGHRTANSEGDNFEFAYSTNGSSYTTITGALISTDLDVTGGNNYAFGNSNLQGTVYIRVIDKGLTGAVLDTVYVDHLTILTVP